jgi:hypothetical protein
MKSVSSICGILAAAFLTGCSTPSSGTRAALEYRVEWMSADEMQDKLNKLANEGWVLVTAYKMDTGLREVTLSRQKR